MIKISQKFNNGDKVTVVKKGLDSYGLNGIIADVYVDRCPNSVLVTFDDWKDRHEEKTLCISKSNLEKIDEREEYNMMINGEFRVVMVKFVEGYDKSYRQFALYEDANVGDYVLCDNKTGYTLGTIGEILSYEEAKAKNKIPTKEVICVCNFDDFNTRKERKAKANELKNRMDKRIKEIQSSQVYEMFAEKDDTLKDLLAQYNKIVG